MFRRIVAVCVLLYMIMGALTIEAEETAGPVRVMVLPFDGTSGGDYSYLTDSVRTMISSRLSAKKRVELVDYTLKAEDIRMLNNSEAVLTSDETLFARFQTDYVITGALYALQTGLQIQVTFTGKDAGSQPGKFTANAVNDKQILKAIEGLVEDISAKGLKIEKSDLRAPKIGIAQERGLAGFTTEHPEKNYKRGIYTGSIVSEGGDSRISSLGVHRSSALPVVIVAMDTGDLDNDGSIEIVTASRTSLQVYRFNETRFQKLSEYRFTPNYKIHAVNIADVDGDGISEIFVSGNDRLKASSTVFTWNASTDFNPLLTEIDWYIRPLQQPGKGMTMVGQRSSNDPEDGYVNSGIVELAIAPGYTGVSEMQTLPLPRTVRLFDFEYADIDGDGVWEVVAVDHRERLLVYDNSNNLIWVSEEDYGGSRNFLGPPNSALNSLGLLGSSNDRQNFERLIVYIPTKVVVADIDNDGKQEIIIGKNERQWSKWLRNSREYNGGSVACLGWRDSGMQEIWRTNKISGYIADYNFVNSPGEDTNIGNPDTAELYVAQVPNRMLFGLLLDAESKMLKYKMDTSSTR